MNTISYGASEIEENNSGNEDPNKSSFASIDHAELVRQRFQLKNEERKAPRAKHY